MAERRPLIIRDGLVEEIPVGDTISTAIAPGGVGGGGDTNIFNDPYFVAFDRYISQPSGASSISDVLAKGVGFTFTENRTILNVKCIPGTLGQTFKISVWEVDQVPDPAIVQTLVWESETITVTAEMVDAVTSFSTGPNAFQVEAGKSYSFLATLVGAGTFVNIAFSSVNPDGTTYISARDGHRINNAGDITGLNVFYLADDHYIFGFDSIPTSFLNLVGPQPADIVGFRYTTLTTIPLALNYFGLYDLPDVMVDTWGGTANPDGTFTVPASLNDKWMEFTSGVRFTSSIAGALYIDITRASSGHEVNSQISFNGSASTVSSGPVKVYTGDIINFRIFVGASATVNNTATSFVSGIVFGGQTTGGGGGGSSLPVGGTTGQLLAKIDATDGNAEWVDPPSGGGGGASTVEDLTDMDIVYPSLLADDVGRVMGLKSLTGGVPSFGLLGTELPKMKPLGGGIDILVDQDFSTDPASVVNILNIDQYERIVFTLNRLVSTGGSQYAFSTNSGSTLVSHSASRARFFDTTTTALDVDSTISAPATTSQMFLGTTSAGEGFAYGELTGMMNGSGILTMRRMYYDTTNYVHDQTAIHELSTLVNTLVISGASSQNFTSGRLVVYGVKPTAQPIPLMFNYSGTPGGALTLGRFLSPYSLLLRSGATGSFRVGSNPSGTETVDIQIEGVSIGSISITSGGVATVSITSDATLAVGELLTLNVAGARTFTDLFGSFQSELST